MSEEHYQRVHAFNSIPTLHPAIFHDDCSGTFNYVVTKPGPDDVAAYQTDAAYTGTKGIFLRTRVTGMAIGDTVEIRKYVIKPPTQLVRLQLIQGNPHISGNRFVDIMLHWYDGTNVYLAYIRLNSSNETILYAHNMTPDFTATGLHWEKDIYWWNHIDLSLNILHHTFHSLSCNGEMVDLSHIALPSVAATYRPSMAFTINLQTRVAAYVEARFDHILITPENP